MPVVDLDRGGWQVAEGQAVWRAAYDRPELAGDLTVARRNATDAFVQFTKTPFPLVTAQGFGNRWHIEFSSGPTLSGKGAPPERLIWFHLPRLLEGGAPPPAGWTQETLPERRWRLQNDRTGELLEGYFNP